MAYSVSLLCLLNREIEISSLGTTTDASERKGRSTSLLTGICTRQYEELSFPGWWSGVLFENVGFPPFCHSCLPSKHGKKSSLPQAASSLAQAP